MKECGTWHVTGKYLLILSWDDGILLLLLPSLFTCAIALPELGLIFFHRYFGKLVRANVCKAKVMNSDSLQWS